MGRGRKFCVLRARLDFNSLTTTVHPIGNRHAFATPTDCRTLLLGWYYCIAEDGSHRAVVTTLSDARATDPICCQVGSTPHCRAGDGGDCDVCRERNRPISPGCL